MGNLYGVLSNTLQNPIRDPPGTPRQGPRTPKWVQNDMSDVSIRCHMPIYQKGVAIFDRFSTILAIFDQLAQPGTGPWTGPRGSLSGYIIILALYPCPNMCTLCVLIVTFCRKWRFLMIFIDFSTFLMIFDEK